MNRNAWLLVATMDTTAVKAEVQPLQKDLWLLNGLVIKAGAKAPFTTDVQAAFHIFSKKTQYEQAVAVFASLLERVTRESDWRLVFGAIG